MQTAPINILAGRQAGRQAGRISLPCICCPSFFTAQSIRNSRMGCVFCIHHVI